MQIIDKSYRELVITGEDRNTDIGVAFTNTTPIHIENLFISNVFIGWLKLTDAQVTIGRLQVWDFGGDGGNLRGSNLYVYKYITYKPTPTRPYSTILRKGSESIEEALARKETEVYLPRLLKWEYSKKHKSEVIGGYHVDAGFQAYACKEDMYSLDENGVIANIEIADLVVDTDGKSLQTIALTEKNRYTAFNLGYDSFSIATEKEVGIIINQLDDSAIGNEDARCNTKLMLSDRKGTQFPSYDNLITGIDVLGTRVD